MSNAYFGALSPEPYYLMGHGYKCQDDWQENKYGCGKEFATRKEYVDHVIKNHPKKEASGLLDWKTYAKYFEPEEYAEHLKEIERCVCGHRRYQHEAMTRGCKEFFCTCHKFQPKKGGK